MITKDALIKEINIVRKVKEKGDYYDNLDEFALYGYLHALLFVNGKVKSKYNNESKIRFFKEDK